MLYWIKLRRIRIREQKNLDKGNLKMFKKIIEYISNSNLKYLEKEEALHQIMDILLESQAEHKSADVIIEDYEVFCKSIVKEYTKDKGIIYTGLHYFQRSVASMLFMLVPIVIFLKIFNPNMNTGINTYLFTFTLGYAFILMPFTHNNKQKMWASVIYLIVMLWTNSFFAMSQWGTIIDKKLINSTNFVLLGLLLIVVIIEIYKRLCDRRSY